LMGKRMREWQDITYVLGYFEKRAGAARKAYRSYVEKGIALGKRPELTGGGLIRSLGGWDDVKNMIADLPYCPLRDVAYCRSKT
jgi:putative transposase